MSKTDIGKLNFSEDCPVQIEVRKFEGSLTQLRHGAHDAYDVRDMLWYMVYDMV